MGSKSSSALALSCADRGDRSAPASREEMWRGEIASRAIAETTYAMGITMLQGFNREECASIFNECLKTNPTDAFAHWAVAYCNGADYNMYGPVYESMRESESWPSLKVAHEHACRAVALEKAENAWQIVYRATELRFRPESPKVYAAYLSDSLRKCDKNHPISFAFLG